MPLKRAGRGIALRLMRLNRSGKEIAVPAVWINFLRFIGQAD